MKTPQQCLCSYWKYEPKASAPPSTAFPRVLCRLCFFLFQTEMKCVCGKSVIAKKLCFCSSISGVLWWNWQLPRSGVAGKATCSPAASAHVLLQPQSLLLPFRLCLGVTHRLQADPVVSYFPPFLVSSADYYSGDGGKISTHGTVYRIYQFSYWECWSCCCCSYSHSYFCCGHEPHCFMEVFYKNFWTSLLSRLLSCSGNVIKFWKETWVTWWVFFFLVLEASISYVFWLVHWIETIHGTFIREAYVGFV